MSRHVGDDMQRLLTLGRKLPLLWPAALLVGCMNSGSTGDPPVSTVQVSATVTCGSIQRDVSGTIADTTIAEGTPNTNQGSSTNLWTGTTSSGLAHALVRFDTSFIPEGSTIVSATATIYVANPAVSTVRLHRVLAPWNEATVTWNSFAGAYDATTLGSFQTGIYGNRVVDIAPLVQAWASGEENHGLLLEEDAGARTGYGSSENTNRSPIISVCWEEPEGPPLTCGDGVVDEGEECDDGNASNTDACLNVCKNAACGDSFVWAGVEECDDGNASNTDACLTTCELAMCGDGFVQAGVEECDDANCDETDACLTTCEAAVCGDGIVRAGVETCDDGNTADDDACPGSCQPAVCGDGYVLAGVEACDDGNTQSDDGCTATCDLEYCGDGVVQSREDCEDGNLIDGDGCDNDCTFSGSIDWETQTPRLVSGAFACTSDYSTTGRKIAIDEGGTIYVAMTCAGQVRVASSTDGGNTYGPPVDLGISATAEVSLAGGSDGVVYVAAVTTPGAGAVVFSRSVDHGATFSAPVQLDSNIQSDRLGLAADRDTVYVVVKSWAAGTPLHLWRNTAAGVGTFALTEVAMPVSYYDVLIDPMNDNVWLTANYPGSLQLRRSTNGGVTFGAISVPPGAVPYGDWTIGGGNILTAGYGDTTVVRVPTGAPTTSNTAGGLPYLPDTKMRAISANASGDSYIVSRLSNGNIQLNRLLHGAATVASDDTRVLAAGGRSPGVVALPDAAGAAVVYQVGNAVYATVQVY